MHYTRVTMTTIMLIVTRCTCTVFFQVIIMFNGLAYVWEAAGIVTVYIGFTPDNEVNSFYL